jgi:hypothetical protein
MGVGAEGGELAAKRDNLGQCRGAVGVGQVALLRGVHDVAAAPKIVEGVVDGDGADAVLVGQFHGGVHRRVGGGLAELAVGVPDLGGGEAGRLHLDGGVGFAALGSGTEEMIQVKGLEAVVRADAVARGLRAEAGSGRGLLGRVSAVAIRSCDKVVVLGLRDDVEDFHGGNG